MNEPINLPSGATLLISIADFDEANRLKKTIARELASVRIDLKSLSLEDIAIEEIDSVKNIALQLLASDAVEAALWPCMSRCLYNNTPIDRKTFLAESAREDFHPIAWEVARYNLRPFVKSLLSLFKTSAPAEPNDQTSG